LIQRKGNNSCKGSFPEVNSPLPVIKDWKIVIGKKVEMTRAFDAQKRLVLGTVVEAVPCFVAQVKEAKMAMPLFNWSMRRKEIYMLRPLPGHSKNAGLATCEGL
jgi:ribosomal protein L3